MIEMNELARLADQHDMEVALTEIEEMIDARIVNAVTTFSNEFSEKTVFLPERWADSRSRTVSQRRLGSIMAKLSSVKQDEVRRVIVEKYQKAGYPITWKYEDVGYNGYGYVLRIMDIKTALTESSEDE